MEKNPRIDKLKGKIEQLGAQMRNLEAKERTREKKMDTRRKILVGAYYIEQMEKDEALNEKILAKLDGFLTRPLDRRLFDLSEKPLTKNRQAEKPANEKKNASMTTVAEAKTR